MLGSALIVAQIL